MTNLAPLLERARDLRVLPAPDVRRALRRAAGLSLEDIAEQFGVSRQAVGRWERGERQPRPEHLRPYAELLRALQEPGADG